MSNSSKEDKPIWIAAVEGGGTSFRVAICQTHTQDTKHKLLPVVVYRTEVDSSHNNPQQTIQECANFLQQHAPVGGYQALGIATFGPVGVRPDDPAMYGCILGTSPKAAWRHIDLLTPLKKACMNDNIRVLVETDVNAPALAEYLRAKHSTSPSLTSVAYVTVGTGVGVGLVLDGKPVHGRMHPEGGHVPAQPLEGDTFGGYSWGSKSPFRGKNTVEGLASSVALTERLEQMQPSSSSSTSLSRSVLSTLPDDHDVWKHAANALANLCATLLLTVSVEKIVLGGGIMKRQSLLPQIQKRTIELINGYLELPDERNMSSLITTSEAGDDAGLVGAIVLAQHALGQDGKDKDEDDLHIKRTAFGHGLWHGFLVGAVGTAVICRVLWMRHKR